MTDHLDATLHNETLPANALLAQNTATSADGISNDLRTNYDSENENEKPILLELGVTSNNPRTTAELTPVPYTNNYPLDAHLNSIYVSGMSTLTPTFNTDRTLLYNNPYNNGIPTTLSQVLLHTPTSPSVPSALMSPNNIPYTAHIPQTVYTWSTPTPVTSITPVEVGNKLRTEIVPPPVYISYSDVRDYTINKQKNSSWKEKALQTEKDYKKTACDRERTRMRDMNRAFDLLRSKLPISKPNGKKYSKIESLRIAINYINHLQKTLSDNIQDPANLTTEKYLSEFNVRRRSNTYRYENLKQTNFFEDANDKFEHLDESRSTWSDEYVAKSEDKWQ